MIIPDYDHKKVEALNILKITLDNFGEPFRLNWFITKSALMRWNKNRNIKEELDPTSFRANQRTNLLINEIVGIINRFIQKNKGYPSANKKANKAYFIFCFSNGQLEQKIGLSEDLKYFYYYIDIEGRKGHLLSLDYIAKHELLHGVSRAKENEKAIVALIDKYARKEEKNLGKYFTTLDKRIVELEKYIARGSKSWENTLKEIRIIRSEEGELNFLRNYEFKSSTLVLNMMADSVLTILAMEYNDEEYVHQAVKDDEYKLLQLQRRVKHISGTREILKDEKSRVNQKFLKIFEAHEKTLIVCELILFLRYLPLKGLPVMVIGEKFRNNTGNPFFNSKYHEYANNNYRRYIKEAEHCHESEFIKWFINSYISCLIQKLPAIDEPYRQLHSDKHKYEQLTRVFQDRLNNHLASLHKLSVGLKKK